MKNKRMYIAAVAAIMMAVAFSGVVISDSADAAAPDYKASYVVNGTTYVKTSTTASITLATLSELGATAPEGVTFDKWKIGEETYNESSTYVFKNTTPIEIKPVYKATEYEAVFMDGETQVGETITGVVKTVADDGVGSITSETPTALSSAGPADLTKDGFIFLGWVAEGAAEGTEPVKKAELPALTADVTFNAVWMVDYKIMFVDGDKTNTMKVSTVETPAEVTREGFTFLGWYIGTEQIEDPAVYAKTVTADTTFTAKWEPVLCTVTFMAGETVLATQPVKYGDLVNEPVVQFPEGYSGWDFDFTTVIKADTTVNALAVEVFDVIFKVDDSTFPMKSNAITVPSTDKIGFDFKGWKVEDAIVDLEAYEIAADTTFTAVFEPKVFDVIFMDGDKTVLTQTVKYGEKASLPSTAFIGWQTKSVEVIPGEGDAEPVEKITYTDYDFATPVKGDLVLYGVPYVEEPASPYTMTLILLGSILGLIVLAVFISKVKKGEIIIGRAKKDNDDGTNGGAY